MAAHHFDPRPRTTEERLPSAEEVHETREALAAAASAGSYGATEPVTADAVAHGTTVPTHIGSEIFGMLGGGEPETRASDPFTRAKHERSHEESRAIGTAARAAESGATVATEDRREAQRNDDKIRRAHARGRRRAVDSAGTAAARGGAPAGATGGHGDPDVLARDES